MRALLAALCLAAAGCATLPPADPAAPSVYRPAQPIAYPLPR